MMSLQTSRMPTVAALVVMISSVVWAENHDADLVPMQEVSDAYQAGDYETARAGIAGHAEAGNVVAQYRLGYMIANAQGGPFDRAEAIKWLEMARQGGHDEGLILLARSYLSGSPEAEDYARAAAVLADAVTKGDAEAHYLLGQLYRAGRGVEANPATAFELIRKAASAGAIKAQFALAQIYARGEGTQADPAQAARWLLQSGEAGHAPAQMALYQNYKDGTGFPQSEPIANSWLKAAAEGGHALAEQVYGGLLLVGQEGVIADPPRGIAFLTQAAEKGMPGAQSNLGYAYATGTGVETDLAQAAVWYQRAADQGLTRAALAVAELYKSGAGVDQDTEAAVKYYRIALLGQSQVASAQLGGLVVSGTYQGASEEEALTWVSDAADLGLEGALDWLREAAITEPYAAYRLGRAISQGAGGVEPDAAEAAELLQRAARGGITEAQVALVEVFAAGIGVDQDILEAHKWANVAAAAGSDDAAERRDTLANLMTPDQIAEAQARARRLLAGE